MKPGGTLASLGLDAVARGILIPVMSLIALQKGLSLSQLAIGLAIYSVAAFLLEVPSGILADILGRKRVFLLAQVVYSLALVLFSVAAHPALLYITLALYGVARALASGSMDALYIDLCLKTYGQEQLPKASMRLELGTTGGYACGALLGGGLNWAGQMLGGEGLGSMFTLLASLVVTLLALTVGAVFTKDMPRPEAAATPSLKQQLQAVGAACTVSPALPILLGATLLSGFALALLETFWQPRFTALLPGPQFSWLLGVLGFAYFVASALGSVLAARLLKKQPVTAVYLLFGFLFGTGLLLLSLTGSAVLFGLLYLVVYLLLGVSSTAQSVLIHRATPSEVRATLLSGQGFALQIGGFLASCGAGIAADHMAIPIMWRWGGGLFLAGLVFTGLLLARRKTNKTK